MTKPLKKAGIKKKLICSICSFCQSIPKPKEGQTCVWCQRGVYIYEK